MEAILTAYKILFNIQFELVGYKDDLRSFIKIIPDSQTKELHMKYAMLQRFQKSSSTFLIEVEPQGSEENKTMFMLPDDETFRYQVKFSSGAFITLTNLASYNFDADVLVLTNEANHKVGSEILLSAPIVAYNSAHEYKKGYLVHSGGTFYKALKESNSGDAHGVGETTYWKSIPAGDTFVSQADLQNRGALANPIDRDTVILLEIKHKLSLPVDYQLLDGASKCKEINYKVKLHNMN
jgi:hypothetical protein